MLFPQIPSTTKELLIVKVVVAVAIVVGAVVVSSLPSLSESWSKLVPALLLAIVGTHT